MLSQIIAIAQRVVRQLLRDRRFLALSVMVPLVTIYMLYLFFDAVNRPFFDAKEFVPPVGAFIVHFITYVLCATVLVRERTAQTMTRMFVSGYSRAGIIGGYVLAYSIIATVQSFVVLAMLNWLFELEYSLETFASLYGIIWLLAIISIALGILVSNFARNEGQVLPMIPLMLMPSVFFSGMIVSVEQLPGWASYVALTTPMYYATNQIDTLLAGSVVNVLSLMVYGAVVMSLAIWTLREGA